MFINILIDLRVSPYIFYYCQLTHIHTHTQTQTQTHTDTHRHRHTHTQTHTHRHRHTQTHTDIHRHRHTQTDIDTHIHTFVQNPPSGVRSFRGLDAGSRTKPSLGGPLSGVRLYDVTHINIFLFFYLYIFFWVINICVIVTLNLFIK